MIVADASGLGTLANAGVLELAVAEFEVHTTDRVVTALETVSAFHGPVGDGARLALVHREGIVFHRVDQDAFETSRLDAAQGGCATLARDLDADALVTGDLRAVPELDRLAQSLVASPSLVLVALVRMGALTRQDARFRLEALADAGGWLGKPFNRRALASLDEWTG